MRMFQAVGVVLTLGIILFSFSTTKGQSFSDNALLFSRTKPPGSARIQAMGGAQVALGGDYSSALSNPAGLGMYNRSEMTLSFANSFMSVDTRYFGSSTKESNSVFNVPGLSFVFNHRAERNDETGFIGGAFAVTLSRINDLNLDYEYAGTNNESSIIDYFIEDAYGRIPDEMLFGGNDFYNLTALAYNNYLIEDFGKDASGNTLYGSVLSPLPTNPGEPQDIRTLNQLERIKRKGAQYQWSLAYGANFSDRFFAGANLGIARIRYKNTQVFEESNLQYSLDPSYNPIDSYRIEEDLDIQGSGVNLTFGVIYRPFNFIQLGASYATPTWYEITETYDARVYSFWNDFDYYGDGDRLNNVSEQFGDPLLGEYRFRTPSKLNAGATLISKLGFVTADVEFVNFGKAKYKSDIVGIDYDSDNAQIKSSYNTVMNYRIGAEFRYNILRVRAGFNVMSDPYRQNTGVDRKIQSVSAGIGIRLKNFFSDLALVSSSTNGRRVPYTLSDLPSPVATQEIRSTNIMLTLGVTFGE